MGLNGAELASTDGWHLQILGGSSMTRTFLGALSVMIMVSGCGSLDRSSDDELNEARAACETEAFGAVDEADVQSDQRSAWIEDYTSRCMERKGF
jgi:hypothetical protein